jgi:hypothetical protein
MSLLVYVPNSPETSPLETLKRVGLYELHDEGPACIGAAVNGHGPDGGGGALFGWPGIGEVLAMNLERQEWHECSDQAWIGWDRTRPPTPDTLKRKKQLGGYLLKLADDREWLIPAASQAPRRMGLDKQRHVSAVMLPQYQIFFEAAWKALNSFIDEKGKMLIPNVEESFAAAVRILAMNYRMAGELATVLGIINHPHLWEIPKTCCEAPLVADFIQKKRARDMVSTSSGEAG